MTGHKRLMSDCVNVHIKAKVQSSFQVATDHHGDHLIDLCFSTKNGQVRKRHVKKNQDVLLDWTKCINFCQR